MTPPKIIGALLARNEAAPDRYLQRALDNAAQFVDGIVVLDDDSDDATPDICERHPKVVAVERRAISGGWWGGAQGETPARARLWELACEHAGLDGWIAIYDADHELLGITPREFRALTAATAADCWACPLWDCWDSDDTQRVDGYWQAWHSPRAWLFRALPGPFPVRAIHVGHAPMRAWTVGLMPNGAGVRHLGYVTRANRLRKHADYLKLQLGKETTTWTPSRCSPTPKKLTPVP